jgi:hypothetical protein
LRFARIGAIPSRIRHGPSYNPILSPTDGTFTTGD